MSMKVKWKLLNQDAKRGRQKKREKRTPTPTHLARSGQTLKRQGKEKSGGRRKRTKTSGGGGGRKRLNQPTTAKPTPTSARAGPKPTWRGEGHMKKGDQWGNSWWQGTSTQTCKRRDKAQRPSVVKSRPRWRLTCSMNSVHNSTSPDNQKKRGPRLKSWTCLESYPCCANCEMSVKLLSSIQKWNVVAASGYANHSKQWRFPGTAGSCSKNRQPTWPLKMVSPRHSGQLFKTSTMDRVKKGKKADSFTLLRRINRSKCVNSEIKSNVGSTT